MFGRFIARTISSLVVEAIRTAERHESAKPIWPNPEGWEIREAAPGAPRGAFLRARRLDDDVRATRRSYERRIRAIYGTAAAQLIMPLADINARMKPVRFMVTAH
ncbi:MAG TPA: hypothetical protein VD948_08565 [Rhodothermales bacterium]|nr:hypothetical protein [Rhodothermales bacterium]